MTQWYKITASSFSQYQAIRAVCERLKLNPTDEVGLLSFVVACSPKHITLLSLEFPNCALHCYTSFISVLADLAEHQRSTSEVTARIADVF